ncbi:MAG: N-acetyltransferase [Actinobacteria bacterium]|nr:N-acetyltransferase [Actinomycetota bacterium]
MSPNTSDISIRQINSPDELTAPLLADLTALLADAVSTNSSVGFMANSTSEEFADFWRTEFNKVTTGNIVLLRTFRQSVGSVIVSREQRANGRHRAEFRKLLVHSAHQKLGVGSLLESQATKSAKSVGIELLYLDSATMYLVNGIYERWGWQKSGEIPRYALNPDGSYTSTWYFYKDIR